MKVDRVTATIKYSLDTGHGWKAVELGAEATLDPKDTWQDAQHRLYGELSQQLQKMWANGHKAQDGAQSSVETPQVPEPPCPPPETPPQLPEHFCQEHQTPFKRYSRGDSLWWSHKTGARKWCREK